MPQTHHEEHNDYDRAEENDQKYKRQEHKHEKESLEVKNPAALDLDETKQDKNHQQKSKILYHAS